MDKKYEYHSLSDKKSRNRIVPYLILIFLIVITVVYIKNDGVMIRGTDKQEDRNKYEFDILKDITYPAEGFLDSRTVAETLQEKVINLLMESTPLYGYSIESSSKEYGLLMQDNLMNEKDDMTEFCMENEREESRNGENHIDAGKLTEEEKDFLSAFLIQNVEFENIGMDLPQDTAVLSDDVKTDSMIPVSTRKNTTNNYSFFTPAVKKAQEYSINQLSNQDYLLKTFYAVDSGTTAPLDKLEVQKLMSEDLKIDKNTDGPQILIYHTHSQEGFADSLPGDDSTTILGAGEELARILEEDYGYKVLHHTGQYDTKEHDYAYSYALPEITKILEDNPSIQVVIDLHRDEMKEGKKLLTQCSGKPTAQIMFFNGLSYVNTSGAISYLENKNLSSNLAFSFQMQKTANEYYPGFARKIYLKGYRYNMHLAEKYLLIELGAQTNTVEEIKNACFPLADILDKVIGE